MLLLLAAASLLSTVFGAVQFAGVNIAGFDFGCGTDGTCNIAQVVAPLAQQKGPDGAGQVFSIQSLSTRVFLTMALRWPTFPRMMG